jgi:ABC-type uncharacterized transport system fused permease/ATPase subunit
LRGGITKFDASWVVLDSLKGELGSVVPLSNENLSRLFSDNKQLAEVFARIISEAAYRQLRERLWLLLTFLLVWEGGSRAFCLLLSLYRMWLQLSSTVWSDYLNGISRFLRLFYGFLDDVDSKSIAANYP